MRAAIDVQDIASDRLGVGQVHDHKVCAMYSPDRKLVLTGSADNTARLWEAATGKPLGSPLVHQGPVHAIAFSSDGGRVATASADRTARLWETATGKPLGALPHRGAVGSLAFSPDGKRLLTASSVRRLDDAASDFAGELRVWDAGTGKLIGQPIQHNSGIRLVAFAGDGKTILVGSSVQRRAKEGLVTRPVCGMRPLARLEVPRWCTKVRSAPWL